MSSQTMAATMVGRRNHESTDGPMLGFSDSVSDLVDVSAGNAPAFHPSTVASSDLQTDTSLQAADQDQDKDERNAISNLLAQLARNSNAQQADTSTNFTASSTGTGIGIQAPATGRPPIPSTEQDILQRTYSLANDSVVNPNHAAMVHPFTSSETKLWNAIHSASNNPIHVMTLQQENTLETPFPTSPPPATGDSFYRHNPTSAVEQDPLSTEDLPEKLDDSAKRGQVEAYAKLEFADGVYYITTHSCELGRDVRMYNRAKDKKLKSLQSSHGAKSGGSSDKASRPSKRSRREGGSLVKRSVVSEKEGFCGLDDSGADEDVQQQPRETAKRTHSSQPSDTSVVKPQDLNLNVPLPTFDYQHYASLLDADDAMFEDDEQPAPVTSEHLPLPKNSNPLVPIHHTVTETVDEELKNHTSISRRHLRIYWDYKHDCWKGLVLGRNGAFIDNKYLPAKSTGILKHGSKIQIAAIEGTFKLPQTMIDNTTDESEAEEDVSPSMNNQSATPPSETGAMSTSPSKVVGARAKIHIKNIKKPGLPEPPVAVNADGHSMPQKKRGPGRPPKDGIMSNRERREIARAQKAAEAKEANGGVTPPPTGRTKPNRPPVKAEVADPTKPEKRKYTKRKRAETDDVLPSIEGEDTEAAPAAGSDDEARATRKARPSRSRSPDYPSKESLTEDQLAKPSDNYARLIYDILVDIHPRELGLRQIYRELKKKFPYFVHVVQTEGWQSSVRHNLNSEHTKLFEKGQKDGKGWAWRAIKGAMEPKEELEKKRKAQAAAAAAKANANSMPNGPRYPPQGPPRPGQQWQPQQGQVFMYPGMPPNGSGHPQPFYAQPMPPQGVPWAQPYPQGSHPGQPQNVPLRSGSGPPPFPPPGPPWPYPTNGHAPPGVVQMFERPIYPPPSNQNGPYRVTASSGSPNIERPPSRGTRSARAEDAISPCSSEGMAILARFIDAIIREYESEQDKIRAREVFEDAKRVVLHGASEPSFTADTDKEMFGPMIAFARTILKDYPNPDYVRCPVQGDDRQEGPMGEGADEAHNADGDGKEDVEMVGNEKDQDENSRAPNGDRLESRTATPGS